MTLSHNVQLKDLNTLRLPAKVEHMVVIESEQDLHKLAASEPLRHSINWIIGGGSNLLLRSDLPGTLIKLGYEKQTIVNRSTSEVILEVSAGYNWHALVTETVQSGWAGLENLALIPGTVGACPVQNIGAYGSEVASVIESVEIMDLVDGQSRWMKKADLGFGYRTSIFKHNPRWLITKVRFRLSTSPKVSADPGKTILANDALTATLSQRHKPPFTTSEIFEAVVELRTQKLLDPAVEPTVGSFFKNPLVDQTYLLQLQSQLGPLQTYADPSGLIKVPAGQIIDRLGWRGKQLGNCYVSQTTASIFSHNGQASGEEFFAFTNSIANDVYEKTGIHLEPEVNVWPFVE